MRVILSCHCCVIALFAASLGVSAQRLLEDYTHHRPRWIDPYHRAPKKGPITAAPEYPVGFRDDYNQKLAKRGQACDAGYHLCAESLGGDCCPEKYDCATDSCYAATVNPLTWNCAGKVGWYPCEDCMYAFCSTAIFLEQFCLNPRDFEQIQLSLSSSKFCYSSHD